MALPSSVTSLDGFPVIRCEAQLDPNLEVQGILADAKKVNRFIHPIRMIIAGNLIIGNFFLKIVCMAYK